MLSYPYTLTPDSNDTLLIQFPDVPEALGVANDEHEAPAKSLEALAVAFEIYVDQRRAFPRPSEPSTAGPQSVALPVLFASKVFLANQMVAQGVRKADLARMLDIHRPQVDRLLDPLYSSKIETVEAALEAMGQRLEVGLAA